MGRTRHSRNFENAGSAEKRQVILAALAKATADGLSGEAPAAGPESEVEECYMLSLEELTALVNGDMPKIENWVSNLDRRQATWLLRWLIKEH